MQDNYGRLKVFKEIKESLNSADRAMLVLALDKGQSPWDLPKKELDSAVNGYREGMKDFDYILKNVHDPKTKAQLSDTMDSIPSSSSQEKGLMRDSSNSLRPGKPMRQPHYRRHRIPQFPPPRITFSAMLSETAKKGLNSALPNTFKICVERKGDIRFYRGPRGLSCRIGHGSGRRRYSRDLFSKGIFVANRLSEGDLTVEIPVDQMDEIGASPVRVERYGTEVAPHPRRAERFLRQYCVGQPRA